MTLWDDIQARVANLASPRAPGGDFDAVRRDCLRRLSQVTKRPVILYAVDFFNKAKLQVVGTEVLIDLEDVEGFKEISRETRGKKVDILLHSPGGSAEATESIVEVLRAHFTDIRFIIPGVAKSAATMLAMSGDCLLLDNASELGPTDPQMILGNRQSPAGAIRDQFLKAVADLKTDPGLMPAWLPILQQYGPSLLVECENHIALSEELVSKWLMSYMFRGMADRETRAKRIAAYLANDKNFRSHGRRVNKKTLQRLGVKVIDPQRTQALYDAIQELYVATLVTFQGTGAYKIFENSEDAALIKIIQVQPVNLAPMTPPS